MTSSNSESRSPLYGTATFTSMSRLSSSTPSDTARLSSNEDDASSDHHMRRITVSPSPSQQSPNPEEDDFFDDNSIDDTAEVENVLNIDNELDDTEDLVTRWSGSASASSQSASTFTSPRSYSTFPRSFTSASTGFPFFSAGRILSGITERTEPSSRPLSRIPRPENPTPDVLRRSAMLSGEPSHLQYGRSSNEPGSDRVLPPPGRRAGELIAFFEDRRTDSGSPGGHSRTASMPAMPGGLRSPSPFTTSQSTPNVGSTTGYGYGSTTYGYGSRSSSPSKSQSGSSGSSASSASLPISTLLSPPLRGLTSTSGTDTRTETRTGLGTYESRSPLSNTVTNTLTQYTHTSTPTSTPTNTFTGTTTASLLRRPQTSTRSPLASVRNIVAAWKERTPAPAKSTGVSSAQGSAISPSPPPGDGDGLLGVRRRVERVGTSLRETQSGDESPKAEEMSIDMTGLMPYVKGNAKPERIGLLWYLNVHASPPYRWQRCQALLYPHILLLSWIAPGGGRGIVSLDLLNCTSVISVPSPTHPSAQDDVGTIAARLQSAERGGQPLVDMLVPFHLLYGDGVEMVAAESLLERQRWVNYLWDTIHRPMIDRSQTRSPTGSITGSIMTIQSFDSRSSSSSSKGSASTVFVPPFDTIPEMSDLQSQSSTQSRISRGPSLISSHHTGTVDDTAILNQEYVYPGDRRVVPPSRHSSLRRTISLTDLDEEFASAVTRARDARPGLGFVRRMIFGGSPVTVSSGSSLRADVMVTPPPTGRGSDISKSRGSASDQSVTDDSFFSAGSRTVVDGSRTTTSSFYSTTSFTGGRTGLESETFTDLRTDDTSLPLASSGSDTLIISATMSPRRTESASMLSDSRDTVTPTTSTVSLSRTSEIRRRSRTSSRTLSSSYPSYSDDSSDKENSEPYTPTRTHSESDSRSYHVSRSSEFSSLTTPSTTISGTAASFSSSSSSSAECIEKESSSEVDVTPSIEGSDYATARTPTLSEYESLPTIPSESEYDTAEVCSTEFVTVDVCPSEPSTAFTTAEVCSTELTTKDIPSVGSSPVVVEIPVEVEDTWVSLSPPHPVPSIPESPSDVDLTDGIEPVSATLPSSTLSSSLESTDMEDVTPPPLTSSFVSTPTESFFGPTLTIAESLPRTATPTVTESDDGLTPITPSLSSHPVSTPPRTESLWAEETNESYESSILRASPSVGSLALHEGLDTSFETSIMRPSGTLLSSPDRLTPIPETPTASSLLIPASPSPLPVSYHSVSSPTDVPTPTASWRPPLSAASLSRTLSASSGMSTTSMGSSILGPGSLDEPLGEEPSTESSLVPTHHSPTPPQISPPSVAVPSSPMLATPSVSMSVSISTPHTNIPSIRSDLDTIPSDEGRGEILTHDINRLLQYLHDLDQVRGRENHELADNIRAIRGELYNLSDFLRRREPERRDEGLVVSERPAGPRDLPVSSRPILLTPPPPFRVPSPSSIMTTESFLSSHYTDDDLLAEEPYRPWSPPLSPEGSIVSSAPTERPFTSPPSPTSSSSPPIPPPSVTPATSSPSSLSVSTVRPRSTLANLRDLLDGIKNQVAALWDGQLSTNHMLDELRGRRPPPDDGMADRLQAIEGLLQRILDQSQPRQPEPVELSMPSRETMSSTDFSDLDRLRDRLRDIASQQAHPPIQMPEPVRIRPSLDEELAAMLRAEPQLPPPPVQQPPELIPFRYQPTSRESRPRSASPTLPPRPHTVPREAPVTFFDVPHPRPTRIAVPRGPASRPPRPRPESIESDAPVIPSRPPTTRPPRDQDFDDRLRDLRRRRRPTLVDVPPAEPVIPSDLYDRPPTAPADIGRDRRSTRPSWYQPRPPPAAAIPPPGIFGPPTAAPTQGAPLTYIPMPPGPTVVQVPLFDTLMDILRENRLAQLATVEQQRELMRYMRGLNEWLERDVHDRQASLRGVTARVDQLRNDLGRLSMGMRPPGDGQPGQTFVIPQFPPPAVGPEPARPPPGFQPYPDQSGVVPPVIPFPVPERRDRTPSPPFSPVIPGLVGLGRAGGTPAVVPGPIPYAPPPEPRRDRESEIYIPSESSESPRRFAQRPRRDGEVSIVPMPATSETSTSGTRTPEHEHIPGIPLVVPDVSRPSRSRTSSARIPTGPAFADVPGPMDGVPGPPGVQPTYVIQQPPQQGPMVPVPAPGLMPVGGFQPLPGVAPTIQPQVIEVRTHPSRGRTPSSERDRGHRSPPRGRDRSRIRRRRRSPSPSSEGDGSPRRHSPRRRRRRSYSPSYRSYSYSPGRPVPFLPSYGPGLGHGFGFPHGLRRSPVMVVGGSRTPSSGRRSPIIHYPPPAPAPPVIIAPDGGRRSRDRSPVFMAHDPTMLPSRYSPEGRRTPPIILQPTDLGHIPHAPSGRTLTRIPPTEHEPAYEYSRPSPPPHVRRSRSSPPPMQPTAVGYPETRRRYSPRRPRSHSPDYSRSPPDDRYRRRWRSPSPYERYPYDRRRPLPSRYRYRPRSFSTPSSGEGHYSPRFRYGPRTYASSLRGPEDERDEGVPHHIVTVPSHRTRLPPRSSPPPSEDDHDIGSPRIVTVPSRRTRLPPRSPPPPSEDEHDMGSPRIVAVPSRRPPRRHTGPPTVIRPSSRGSQESTPPTFITLGRDGRGPGALSTYEPEEDLSRASSPPRAYHPAYRPPPRSTMEHDEGATPRPRVPSELPQITPAPTTREEDTRRPTVHPSTEDREASRRSPSIVRSIVHRVPPPRSAEGPDLRYGDAERDRDDRFREVEGRLIQSVQTAAEAEDQREGEFRRNEEERNRLFLEHEDRRDDESRQRRDQIWHELEGRLAGPIPAPRPLESQVDRESASYDAASRYATDIQEIVQREREESAREREAEAAERERIRAEMEAERTRIAEEREARIQALETELAEVKAELENERQQRITEEAETRERERQETLERDEAVRNQLGDITNLIQDQRDVCARTKELMDERWAEKQNRREDKDSKLAEIREMVSRIIQDREADQLRAEEDRAAAEARPGIEKVLEELQRQNTEQREHLNALSETWRADCARQHQENLEAVRSTAQEQVPFNVQGYLNDFSKSLASEVKMLLGEVGKLREERRAIQYELGYLLCLKAKIGPGGEFEPDWRPPGAPGGPPADAPPPEPPMPPEEPPPAKPGWRTVHQRPPRRQKLKKEPPQPAPPGPGPAPGPGPGPDPRRQVSSWATWQPDPALALTPPSIEPTLLVPDRGSPGLFGPRSPRDSHGR